MQPKSRTISYREPANGCNVLGSRYLCAVEWRDKFEKAMQAKGWTEAEFLRRSQIPRSSLRGYLSENVEPGVGAAATIARTFGMSLDELFGDGPGAAIDPNSTGFKLAVLRVIALAAVDTAVAIDSGAAGKGLLSDLERAFQKHAARLAEAQDRAPGKAREA